MKWMNAVVCAALLAMAGPAFSEGAPAESPRDYAYGLSLDTSASSPWYRVMLPLAIYQQSTSPDLRDVRVFNQSGEPVPFSLVTTTRPQPAPTTTALRFLRLTPRRAGKRTAAIKLCYGPETVWKLCWKGNTLRLPDSTIC